MSLVDDVVLEEIVLCLVILVDLPLHVLRDELDEQRVDGVLRLDLHRHRYEERDEEEDAARERHDLLRRQVALLVARELLYLAVVRQEAHDRRDGARDHHEQVEEEYHVQDLVLSRDVWEAPVMHLRTNKVLVSTPSIWVASFVTKTINRPVRRTVFVIENSIFNIHSFTSIKKSKHILIINISGLGQMCNLY